MKLNRLFFDMDECLLQSFYADSEKHANQLLEQHGEYWKAVKYHIRHDGWYVSYLRNITNRLLKFSRELLGEDNVYLLSRGDVEYVRWANVMMGLGFDPNTNVFGHQDIEWVDTNIKFKDSFNVLIDNETYEYHLRGVRNKVKYLNNLPREQYIQIDEFNIWKDRLNKDEDSTYVEYMQEKIKNIFDL